VLIIGSGPIITGQACEFDYSDTQACKALRSSGYMIPYITTTSVALSSTKGIKERQIGEYKVKSLQDYNAATED
jgi:carbamoyl-phosphate synthase large subunit